MFVIFALLFMFAGWFLSGSDDRPELQVKVHVAFVLTTITYLVVLPMVFLACFGIPEDIRPPQPAHGRHQAGAAAARWCSGRILGYVGIASVVVATMGVVGYVWIERQVPPEADAALVSREPIYGALTFRGPGRPADRPRDQRRGHLAVPAPTSPGASKARGLYSPSPA